MGDPEAGDPGSVEDERGLNRETWGYPDSPPAILIHGLASDLREWHAVAHILAERYWVVAPDLRGHGRSPLPGDPDDYSLDSLTQDLIGLMDSLEIELAAVIGAGLGASVALNLALTAPARVAALVLADFELAAAGDEADGRVDGRVGSKAKVELVARLGPAGLGAHLAKEVHDPFLAGAIRSRYHRLSGQAYLGGSVAQREAAARFSGAGHEAPYRTPSMPLLVCTGSEGRPRDRAIEFAEAAADGRCLTFDRCPAPLAMHCPEEFADAVVGFFAEIEEAHGTQAP